MMAGNVQLDKPLVFVLDHRTSEDGEEKQPKRRRKSDNNKTKSGPNFKNFGAFVQPSKLKASGKLVIAWRSRQRFGLE